MAREARTSSHELLAAGRHRGCVSRAYYGVYCDCADVLIEAGVTMPYGWKNPKHPPWLSNAVLTNVRRGGDADRAFLARMLPVLHNVRIDADYRPNSVVDAGVARAVLGMCGRCHDAVARIRSS